MRLDVRVGEEHPGALEALRVLAQILLRLALDSSSETGLHGASRPVCRPEGSES